MAALYHERWEIEGAFDGDQTVVAVRDDSDPRGAGELDSDRLLDAQVRIPDHVP